MKHHIKKDISIIMSVYNEKLDYLEKSILSIINQTYYNFEFIIINDGSSDKRCNDLLEKYAGLDHRINLIKNDKNIGLTKSLNKGIKISKGMYIARMDSDDISFSCRLKKQLDFLNENSFDLIGSNCNIIDENEKLIKEKKIILPKNVKKSLIKGNFFTHSTFFGKKKVFDELYNENFIYSQDYEFLIRIVFKKYRLGYLNEPLILYRTTRNNISTKNSKKQDWYAIKARWNAIFKYGYKKIYLIYLVRAFFSFLIPYYIKYFIIYKIIK